MKISKIEAFPIKSTIQDRFGGQTSNPKPFPGSDYDQEAEWREFYSRLTEALSESTWMRVHHVIDPFMNCCIHEKSTSVPVRYLEYTVPGGINVISRAMSCSRCDQSQIAQCAVICLLLLTFGLTSFPVFAFNTSRPARDENGDLLSADPGFREVTISPDGRYVAWTWGSDIFVKDLVGASQLMRKVATGREIVWSRDSRHLAFLCDTGDQGQQQVYRVGATGGVPERVTNLAGALASPQWSPDGRTLSILFTSNPPRLPGAGSPIPSPVGVVGETPSFEQRIALIDLASGHVRIASPSNLYVYEYDWSPDSRQIVATAAPGPGDDDWYVAQIYSIDVLSGNAKSIWKPEFQVTAPRWSLDGKQIAFISGLMSGNLGGNSGDVYVIPAQGGTARNLTQKMKASAHGPNGLVWLSRNRILIREFADGQVGLAEINLQGKIKPLWAGNEFSPNGGSTGEISMARDRRTSAVVLQSLDRPPEVWVGEIGRWKQITHINRHVRLTSEKVESLHWTNGNWAIQGWLTYPRHYDPHRQYPLIVEVHGGPSGMSTAGCGSEFATHGYFVLCPNFRGSAGFGEEFQRADVRDFGYGDLRDILTGVRKVEETLPVDKNRVGITGQSYGGYITMWAVTQTRIFHAAVANAGIADWLSYVAQADIPRWVIPYFGALIYDDPAIYARSAPINFIKNVKTPTLIVVGSGDGECPAPQSLEFWYALKMLGVKTELVIYPGEGHEFRKPENVYDVRRRSLEWFDRYLR